MIVKRRQDVDGWKIEESRSRDDTKMLETRMMPKTQNRDNHSNGSDNKQNEERSIRGVR